MNAKKIFAIILGVVLLLSATILPASAADTLYYGYFCGDTTAPDFVQGSGVGRNNQAACFVHNAPRYPWGADANISFEKLYENYETNPPASSICNDGVLPASGGVGADAKVWWIKTASFPDNDPFVGKVKSDKGSVISNGPSGVSNAYILANGIVPTADESGNYSGSYIFETKVRFDDYNATRYVLSPMYGRDVLAPILTFNTNGAIVAKNKGAKTAAGTYAECDEVIGTYNPGQWYVVKLIYHFSATGGEGQYFSVIIDDNVVLNNVKSAYNFTSSNFTWLVPLSVYQADTSATQNERIFSNSYMNYIKAYTTDTPTVTEPMYYNNYTDKKYIGARIGHNLQGADIHSVYAQPWTGTYAEQGVLATGWESFDQVNDAVYMLQSHDVKGEMNLYQYTNNGAQSIFRNPAYNNVIMETEIRMDDRNGYREVFSWGDENDDNNYRHTVVFNENGSIGAYSYSNGGNAETKLSTWEVGRWYRVKIVMHMSENLYDVYINDNLVAESLYHRLDMNQMYKIKFFGQVANGNGYTNTFCKYSKVYYDPNMAYTSPASSKRIELLKKNAETGSFETATELSNGEYRLSCHMFNNKAETVEEAMVILGLYCGNRLVDVRLISASCAYPTNQTFDIDMNVSLENDKAYEMKVLVWNNEGGLIPLTDIAVPQTLVKAVQ